MITFAKIKTLASALAEVEEGTSYGTPALKVRGKLMARLKEDEETLVVRISWEERERLLAVFPDVFYLTEHYRTGPWVLIRMSAATMAQAKASLLHAWQLSAPLSLQRGTAGKSRGIGVGMPVARHPLHRSVRAELPHTALALGHGDSPSR
jgi:hypothetical protein